MFFVHPGKPCSLNPLLKKLRSEKDFLFTNIWPCNTTSFVIPARRWMRIHDVSEGRTANRFQGSFKVYSMQSGPEISRVKLVFLSPWIWSKLYCLAQWRTKGHILMHASFDLRTSGVRQS